METKASGASPTDPRPRPRRRPPPSLRPAPACASPSPPAAALRELREETGYRGEKAVPLGWVHPNPALQDNRCYAFLARDVVLEGDPEPDGREEIEVVTVPVEEARALVERAEITHALVVCALYLLEGRR